MSQLIFAFLTSFIVVLIATPSLIKVAKLKHLVDEPGDDRKVHSKSIPTIGGIMIFAGTILAFSLWFPASTSNVFKGIISLDNAEYTKAIHDFQYIIACLFILFFVGTKDDIIGFSPIKKLLAHLLVGGVLVFMADIRIESLHGILDLDNDLPYLVSAGFSIFVYIVIVNAINLIDGVDGLAAGIGFLACLSFALWNFSIGHFPLATLAVSLAGALLAFLFFNFNPAKIFMGDSGSLTIGLIMYVLAVGMIEHEGSGNLGSIGAISRPILAMAILAYPLLDTIRVFTLRAIKGTSPFSADRNHLHHHLLDMGLGHKRTVLIIYLFSILVLIITLLTPKSSPNWSLLIVGGTAFILTQSLFVIKRLRKK